MFIIVTCRPTLNVYCNIISHHTHKQFSCTKPLPRGLSVQFLLTKFHDCFYTIAFYFIWLNFLSVRIVNVSFQSAGHWQICHTHQAFKLPLHTLRCKLQTLPTVKSKTMDVYLIKPSNITVYGSTPYVGMEPKKMAATLKVHK